MTFRKWIGDWVDWWVEAGVWVDWWVGEGELMDTCTRGMLGRWVDDCGRIGAVQEKWNQIELRVVVWENRAGSKDGGRPNSIILWALDACLIWLWTGVIEQNLVLLFRRLTTPLCFGAAGAKMAPEIRPTSRRKNTNFPMVFANQFFYDTFMAIITLDDRFTDGVNQCFLSGECRKK